MTQKETELKLLEMFNRGKDILEKTINNDEHWLQSTQEHPKSRISSLQETIMFINTYFRELDRITYIPRV